MDVQKQQLSLYLRWSGQASNNSMLHSGNRHFFGRIRVACNLPQRRSSALRRFSFEELVCSGSVLLVALVVAADKYQTAGSKTESKLSRLMSA
jgi:hypothetical protein